MAGLNKTGYSCISIADSFGSSVAVVEILTFNFEDAAMQHVRERKLDGAICGHIHWSMIKENGGLSYLNCDWVDSCTAFVEHFDGRMEFILWNGSANPTA